MLARHTLLIAPALLLLGCQTPAPSKVEVVTYHCDDGRSVMAVYPDSTTTVLTFGGQTHHLHAAVSADGARYVGDQWQWWTKGMHDARLAPLKPSETIASDTGVSCHAR
jgi:membrane-bound inhibitor of C-type lysozyme